MHFCPSQPPSLQLTKIFNPATKKEFQLYTMRNLSLDVDNPDNLRQALSEQYGDLLLPTDKMEVDQAKKNVDQKSVGLKWCMETGAKGGKTQGYEWI